MIIKMFYLFSTLFKGLSSLAVTYGKWRNAMVQWKNVVAQWKNVVERLQIPSLGSFCSSSLISTQISIILIRFFLFVFFPPLLSQAPTEAAATWSWSTLRLTRTTSPMRHKGSATGTWWCGGGSPSKLLCSSVARRGTLTLRSWVCRCG